MLVISTTFAALTAGATALGGSFFFAALTPGTAATASGHTGSESEDGRSSAEKEKFLNCFHDVQDI